MSSRVQEIIKQMQSVQFEDEEATIIEEREEETKQGILDCTNSCYGKFIATKGMNLKGLRSALSKAWRS